MGVQFQIVCMMLDAAVSCVRVTPDAAKIYMDRNTRNFIFLYYTSTFLAPKWPLAVARDHACKGPKYGIDFKLYILLYHATTSTAYFKISQKSLA